MARPSKLFYWKARKGWYATINGRRERYGDTLAEAEPAFKAVMKATARRSIVRGTVADWLSRFLEHKQQTTRPATYRFYQKFCESFCQFHEIGNLHVSKLRLYQVQDWLAAHPEWKGSKRCAVIAIKVGLRFLQENQALHRDDLDLSKIKRPPAKRRQTWVSANDHRAILSHVKDTNFRDLITFLWNTGCRPYEAYRLRKRHLDMKNSRFLIPADEMPVHKTGKHGSDRIVYLNDEALEIVKRLVPADPEGLLFLNTKGLPWSINSINSRFAHLASKKKVGKRFSPYAYRHGFGTRKIAERKLPDVTIAALMGHKDISMLANYYSHANEIIDDMISAANA